MKQIILFDLDGTVTDPKEGITRSVQYALAQLGIHVDDLDTLEPFIGPPLLDSFMLHFGMDEATARGAIEQYRVRYRDGGIFESTLYGGMDALLASLKASGHKVLLATSKPEVFARQILAHFGIDGHFDIIAGSELDNTRTDKAEVIRYALARLPGADPAQAVMIGDTRFDILGAKAAGLASIGVLYGYGDEASLREAGADWIVPDVASLAALLTQTPQGG